MYAGFSGGGIIPSGCRIYNAPDYGRARAFQVTGPIRLGGALG
jgi:ribosomal protein S28E/S33